jgi:hypothetical protein
MAGLDLSWLGGAVGGAMRGGRAENTDGSVYGGQRTLLKDMGEGIGTATDEKFAADAKKSKTLRALFAQYGDEMGQPGLKDAAHTMSLGQLEGSLQGYILDQDRQRQQRNSDLVKEQIKAMQANQAREAQAQQDDLAGQAAAGNFLKAYSAPTPPESLTRPGGSPFSAALEAAGPDLAKSRNLTAYLHYLNPSGGAAEPYHQMNAEANLLNAKSNYAKATQGPGAKPEALPGYEWRQVNGEWKAYPTKLSDRVTSEIGVQEASKRAAEQAIAELDGQMAKGETKSGGVPGLHWFGSKLADERKQHEQVIRDADARIAALKQSGYGGGTSAPAAGASDNNPLGLDLRRK